MLSILPTSRTGMRFSATVSQGQIESQIAQDLVECESVRKREALLNVRLGCLFSMYRQALGDSPRSFWKACQDRFGVDQATVSRKIRLAAQFAREKGASEEIVLALADAAVIQDESHPATQLLLAFVGQSTTTDLYRKYKIITPAPKGGDVTPRDSVTGQRLAAPRRKASTIDEAAFRSDALGWFGNFHYQLNRALTERSKARGQEHLGFWDMLETEDLQAFAGSLRDLGEHVRATIGRRAALTHQLPPA